MKEKIMNFFIYQFVIFELEEYVLVQNCKGLNMIKNKKLIEFFKILDADNKLCVNKKFLDDFFEEESNEVTRYLLDNELVYLEPEKTIFSKIKLFLNNKVIFESLEYNKIGSKKEIEATLLENSLEMTNILESEINNTDSNTLFIVVLTPFDYCEFLKLNNLLSEGNKMFAFVISYNSSFYITNIHMKKWFNPCPKCFFSQLEASLRAYNKRTTSITFQTIVDLLYNNKINYNPTLPVNRRLVLPLILEILKIESCDINDTASRIVKINDEDGIIYDQAIHWELCNCFE
ncbi:hypothetical protein HMPREF9352_0552 [Streptococcus gallolyticus subsp. gallolyticus TX20005]|nr:hypothetical protein HMPREF9352_0552 [Streptococcus gallolyticus subsp. gallolyticus TX20005]